MPSRWVNTLRRIVPPPLRPLLRRGRQILESAYFFPLDLAHALRHRGELLPPPSLIFVGDGDFRSIGEEFRRYFIEIGGLTPDHSVLDIGCGVGRMAVPLTAFLSSQAQYEGFDIVRSGIEWCQRNITPRFPQFHFQHVNIFNKGYNPEGTLYAEEFPFPYRDGSFDFLFATSVFTHMRPRDMEHYFAEIRRVLRSGGRSLCTFFLLNPESEKLMHEGASTLDFRFRFEGFATIDRVVPENAIAYDESAIRSMYDRHGLRIVSPIYAGSWCGRRQFLSYQDIVIAAKV